jgi:hypothetical protein
VGCPTQVRPEVRWLSKEGIEENFEQIEVQGIRQSEGEKVIGTQNQSSDDSKESCKRARKPVPAKRKTVKKKSTARKIVSKKTAHRKGIGAGQSQRVTRNRGEIDAV